MLQGYFDGTSTITAIASEESLNNMGKCII